MLTRAYRSIMKRILWVTMALLLTLTECAAPAANPEPTIPFKYGIYEFVFSVEQLSGKPTEQWDFTYTYNGETIASGHQILYSLELFTFSRVQVVATQKSNPQYTYSATFPVAICNGGSGKTELTVTGVDGESKTFKIVCNLTQIGKK